MFYSKFWRTAFHKYQKVLVGKDFCKRFTHFFPKPYERFCFNMCIINESLTWCFAFFEEVLRLFLFASIVALRVKEEVFESVEFWGFWNSEILSHLYLTGVSNVIFFGLSEVLGNSVRVLIKKHFLANLIFCLKEIIRNDESAVLLHFFHIFQSRV